MLISGKRFPVENKIFDMFRSGAPNQQQQQTQQPQQPPQQNLQSPQQTNANPNDPSQQQNGQQTQQQQQQKPEDTSPLAEFKGLWENTPVKEGEQPPVNWDDHSSVVPKLNIDSKKLVEHARKIDYSKVIDPALVTKALKEGDVGAFNQILNNALQAQFANMTMSMSRMAESMFTQHAEKMYSGALPHHFRKHQVNQTIDSDNPIFADPAVAPMLEMAKERFQVKYPKASAKEISEMAKKYITNFAKAVGGTGENGQPQKKGGQQQDEDFDWIDFASGGTPQQ